MIPFADNLISCHDIGAVVIILNENELTERALSKCVVDIKRTICHMDNVQKSEWTADGPSNDMIEVKKQLISIYKNQVQVAIEENQVILKF